MLEVNGRSCTCTYFSVPSLLFISSFNIQLQLFLCSSQSQGRDIAIEVNIQLLPIQTCICLAFTASIIAHHHRSCNAEQKEMMHSIPLCRHSPLTVILQCRVKCTGASKSTVSAIMTISNTSAWTMVTLHALLEDMSPSELVCTQLVSQPTQRT